MKILITTDCYLNNIAGITASVLALCKGLRRYGHEIRTLSLSDEGYDEVLYSIACMYFYGDGADIDYEEAVEYLTDACELGSADAMFLLGMCYEEGYGVEQELEMAAELYIEALAAGYYLDEEGETKLKEFFGEDYSEEIIGLWEGRHYIRTNLDKAISEKWIRVYLQPIIRAVNEQVCDVEALTRWIDPEKGFLSPAEFIPALEDAGLVYKLDLYMVDQVLEMMKMAEYDPLSDTTVDDVIHRADITMYENKRVRKERNFV